MANLPIIYANSTLTFIMTYEIKKILNNKIIFHNKFMNWREIIPLIIKLLIIGTALSA